MTLELLNWQAGACLLVRQMQIPRCGRPVRGDSVDEP